MRKFKGILAMSLSALLLAGVMGVTAFAEDGEEEFGEFTISLKADTETAKVGDTVNVSMVLDTKKPLGALTIALKYDPECYGHEAGTAKKGISGEASINDTNDPGKITFSYMTEEGFNSATLMTASFKVLKVNGEFTLEPIVIGDATQDTNDVTQFCRCKGLQILCAHDYGDWETVTEPTVDSTGSRKRVCSLCGHEETEEIPKLCGHEDAGYEEGDGGEDETGDPGETDTSDETGDPGETDTSDETADPDKTDTSDKTAEPGEPVEVKAPNEPKNDAAPDGSKWEGKPDKLGKPDGTKTSEKAKAPEKPEAPEKAGEREQLQDAVRIGGISGILPWALAGVIVVAGAVSAVFLIKKRHK